MTLELTIPGELTGARCAQVVLEELLRSFDYAARDVFAIKLAFEESLVNAIKYGTRMDPDERLFVVFHATPEGFESHITDEASGSTRTVNWPSPAS